MTLPVKSIDEIEVKSEVSENDKILILDSVSEEARLASKEELKWDKGDKWDTWDQWPQWIQWPKGDKGDKGDTWAKGDKWDKGDTGAKWDKWDTWPKGDKWDTGAKGDKWDTGDTWPQGIQWEKGDTGEKWDTGEKGDTGEQWIQWIQGEKWDKGDKGDKWDTGTAATIAVWTTTTWDAGTSASVTNSWTSSNAVFNFVIPKWEKGDKWDKGDTWPAWPWSWDVVWPNSATDWNVVLFDWSTWKLLKDSWKAFTPAWIGALPSSTKYWASITVSINTTDYKITTTLKDQDWNTLGTAQVIDLPLESVVVSGSYDSVNKKVILTLQNGNTIEFSVADLVSGLQTEITSSNKLDADLVDDSTSTNKFVSASDKSNWNWKADDTDVVHNTWDEDISWTKTFKWVVKVQNWQWTWSMWIWWDTNGTTLRNNQRHLARISVPSYSDITLWATLLWFDSSWDADMHVANKTYDVVSFGWQKKITNATSPLAIWFTVATERNGTASNKKVYPLEMDANEARFNVKPNYNWDDLATEDFVDNAVSWKQDTLVAWTNIQIANDWKTISATDTTYESKQAASWWTDVSLVTTWEKYTWNSKQDALVNQSNIKSVNGNSLLWSGDLEISWLPSGWTAWQVLTKTANWADWENPSWWIENDTTWTTTTVAKIWAWTEAEYSSLSTKDEHTIYYTF